LPTYLLPHLPVCTPSAHRQCISRALSRSTAGLDAAGNAFVCPHSNAHTNGCAPALRSTAPALMPPSLPACARRVAHTFPYPLPRAPRPPPAVAIVLSRKYRRVAYALRMRYRFGRYLRLLPRWRGQPGSRLLLHCLLFLRHCSAAQEHFAKTYFTATHSQTAATIMPSPPQPRALSMHTSASTIFVALAGSVGGTSAHTAAPSRHRAAFNRASRRGSLLSPCRSGMNMRYAATSVAYAPVARLSPRISSLDALCCHLPPCIHLAIAHGDMVPACGASAAAAHAATPHGTFAAQHASRGAFTSRIAHTYAQHATHALGCLFARFPRCTRRACAAAAPLSRAHAGALPRATRRSLRTTRTRCTLLPPYAPTHPTPCPHPHPHTHPHTHPCPHTHPPPTPHLPPPTPACTPPHPHPTTPLPLWEVGTTIVDVLRNSISSRSGARRFIWANLLLRLFDNLPAFAAHRTGDITVRTALRRATSSTDVSQRVALDVAYLGKTRAWLAGKTMAANAYLSYSRCSNAFRPRCSWFDLPPLRLNNAAHSRATALFYLTLHRHQTAAYAACYSVLRCNPPVFLDRLRRASAPYRAARIRLPAGALILHSACCHLLAFCCNHPHYHFYNALTSFAHNMYARRSASASRLIDKIKRQPARQRKNLLAGRLYL